MAFVSFISEPKRGTSPTLWLQKSGSWPRVHLLLHARGSRHKVLWTIEDLAPQGRSRCMLQTGFFSALYSSQTLWPGPSSSV